MNDSKVPEWLLSASNRIIEHMNEDHSNSIVSTLNAQHGIKDKNVKMFALSTDGYYVYSKKEIFFISFNKLFINYSPMLIKVPLFFAPK